MRKFLSLVSLVLTFSCGALAQESEDSPSSSQLRGDYSQVGLVARVKVKSVKFAAPDVHPLYILQSEVIEPFKGKVRRGQMLNFYLAVEEDFDVNTRLGDWIVFLQASSNTPDKKWGWFALENSSLPYSGKTVFRLRKIKATNARRRNTRRLAIHPNLTSPNLTARQR